MFFLKDTIYLRHITLNLTVVTKFNDNSERTWTASPFPLTPALFEQYPDIISYTRYWYGGSLVKYGDKAFYEDKIRLVDQNFLEMFSFKILKGSVKNALLSKNSIIITESNAEKYFDQEDPIGKILNVNEDLNLTVKCIIEDPPRNSIFDFSMLANMEHVPEERLVSWAFAGPSYILLEKGVDKEEIEAKIKDFYKSINSESEAYPVLQNIEDIYLYENFKPGRIIYVYIFSLIALMILVLACINYVNLTTANSLKRSKEIGVRKVFGAKKHQIILQFIGESIIFTFLGLLIALILVELVRPYFNNLTGKELQIIYNDSHLVTFLLQIVFFVGIISGLFPTLVLASFKPVDIFKGNFIPGVKGKWLKNLLVIFQFTIATILIITSITIKKQLNYINNKNLGLNKENILVIPFIPNLHHKFDQIKDELLKYNDIVSVTAAYNLPTNLGSYVSYSWEGNPSEDGIGIYYNMVDYDFIETMEMEMVAGRSFSENFADDDSISYIINESAFGRMNVENAVGLGIEFRHPEFPERFKKGKIIGVVKDFHLKPLREEIVPIAMRMYKPWYLHIFIKYKTNNVKELIAYTESLASKFAPDYPFSYEFFDDKIQRLYSVEYKVDKLITYFTILSIIISCLGLLGLTIHKLEQKTKEIGIRKSLGAGTLDIINNIMLAFMKLVLLSFTIGSIISVYIVRTILENYAYKTKITIWIFIIALIIIVLIAAATIILNTHKASKKNPIDSLRYE